METFYSQFSTCHLPNAIITHGPTISENNERWSQTFPRISCIFGNHLWPYSFPLASLHFSVYQMLCRTIILNYHLLSPFPRKGLNSFHCHLSSLHWYSSYRVFCNHVLQTLPTSQHFIFISFLAAMAILNWKHSIFQLLMFQFVHTCSLPFPSHPKNGIAKQGGNFP